MTVHVVVMTGRNVANLAPLLHQWVAGDRVVLVPTSEATEGPTDWFRQRLEQHGIAGQCALAPTLASHPKAVAEWLERGDVQRLLQPPPPARGAVMDRPDAAAAHAGTVAEPLQLVGNGGTKPLQDMLRAGLTCRQGEVPVKVVYAEARPARLLVLQDGGPAVSLPWPGDGAGMVTLEDVLDVCGHQLALRTQRPLWSGGRVLEAACPEPWAVDALAAHADTWQAATALIDALRQQVAFAMLDLLANRPALAAITAEVWLRPQSQFEGEIRASWDVLLLLRNGILVHLDCSAWHPLARDDCHAAMQALIDSTVRWVPLPPGPRAPGGLAEHCDRTLRHHHRLGRAVQAWLWPGSQVDLGRGRRFEHGPNCIADALCEVLAPYLPPPV